MVDNITARFNEIYNSTQSSTLAYIAAKCSDMADINDIFQETYMELYRVMLKKGTEYIRNEEAFAIKIAKQRVYRHYSMFGKVKADIPLSSFSAADEKEIYDIENCEETIDDALCTKELVDEIESYLKTKPQDIQKVFFLRFSLDLQISEIARLMNTSESQIKNKLYRTIKEIRTFYTQKEEAI